MTNATLTYSADDAVDMLVAAGVFLLGEIEHLDQSYQDICEEIARDGGIADFDQDEYLESLELTLCRRR